ncbi:MAG: HIT family protein [Ignavibacteria bacterium CG2_30_36_16]|nr:HIT domain-containing protein [Ignavibacteria bacterium]OIP63682.1 MAG: HIT family protein [Ignavibacteria bacterium CG2_30_36_16]PJB00931.1 MAG: HIT family protein [Ignavibacteria bacterium CG_4_9_14_3_um_filter_36_18]
MENLKKNLYSHLTAKERKYLSFPAKLLLNKKLLVGDVLDFGCGFGKDVEMLATKGIKIVGYDTHYFPTYPAKKFDTIICFYVLNVLMQEEQANVLMEVSQLLKPTGKAYFAVRRDLQYEGFRTHKVHQKPTYQCNVKLGYKSIFKNENCEIYEYRLYNQFSRKENPTCPFCNSDSERELIVESATAYAIYDKFPVNNGHALIIPKKHCSNYFDLNFKEQSACWFVLNKVKQIVSKKFNPDGFNVGVNVNSAAGQTVPHIHIHLIPRYKGDVKNPTGGVRNVIPTKGDYTI